MSLNVLVIPEDFRKDQYMLKPIVEAMFRNIGRPNARIRVCQDPLLGGISEALKKENIESIVKRYGMVDIFLLCVDRDGDTNRRNKLNNMQTYALSKLSNKLFIAENAWQEIEVWVLAGHNLPNTWRWNDIRSDPNPKENYFLPYSQHRDLFEQPHQGRKILADEAAKEYKRIRQRCPEDICRLEQELSKKLS